MNMRRKPNSQSGGGGFNNNQRRPQGGRPQGGGGGGGGQYNRPRKNYGQLREKYLAQARDAMASGDRVLAENYLQHADHCYRMMVEENANRPQPQPRPQQQRGEQNEQQEASSDDAGNQQMESEEDLTPPHSSALPSFITGGFDHAAAQKPVEPAQAQNWEERDAE